MLLELLLSLFIGVPGHAQTWFPSHPEGLTIIASSLREGISISYKQTYICETTPGVKAYSGYVHMPSTALQDIEGVQEPYNTSMFFWYFQARNDPQHAPLSFYFAGGPGESSMDGATAEGGPCIINPDSNSTHLNPWSFNTNVNMLYIDQPVSTGFSYNSLVQSSLDLLGNPTAVPLDPSESELPATNATFILGTLPDFSLDSITNTTGLAAKTLWLFAQVWLADFPEYTTSDDTVSIWSNSYGGYFSTGFAFYILQQNQKITNGMIDGFAAREIRLNTLGLMNDCFDQLYQGTSYAEILYNNTYGLHIINETVYNESIEAFTKPSGCRDQIVGCRREAAKGDPQNLGNNATIIDICQGAGDCFETTSLWVFTEYSNRSVFDLAHFNPDPWPPQWQNGFLNQEWVQRALGVPVNFTDECFPIEELFFGVTGDPVRREGMKELEYILDSGVKVAMAYGDRDTRCNWIGAETASLAANFSYADDFRKAGYQYVHTNDSYLGGSVRQYDKFSFTRVYQAGHSVMTTQPETIYQIFERAMFDKDISTGEVALDCDTEWETEQGATSRHYATAGPSSSWHMYNGTLPSAPPVDCNIWAISTCTTNQIVALTAGNATIVDYKVVDPAS